MKKKMAFDWPDYEKLANYLFTAGTPLSPAYLHGMIVARLCVDSQENYHTLAQLLIQKGMKSKLIESLIHLTQKQLRAFEGIRLMLPEDEEPLSFRLEGVADWCEGFLDNAHEKIKQTKPNVKEVLEDFAQIKMLSFNVQENEDNEKNYMEIIEFIRIGVLLIYDEYMRVPIVEKQLH